MENLIFSLVICYPELVDNLFQAVRVEDVIDANNRSIYVALDTLHTAGKTIDAMSVMHEAGASTNPSLNAHMVSMLDDLGLGSPVAFPQYIEVYKEEVLKHKLAAFGYCLCDLPNSKDKVADMLSDLEAQFNTLIESHSVKEHDDPYEMYLTGLEPGELTKQLVPWGISAMKSLMLGMGPGEMHVLAARPGMGKTTLALNVALKYVQSQKEKAVCIYSLEMSTVQLVKKLVSSKTGISSQLYHNNMLTEEQLLLCSEAAKELKAMPNLYLNDTMTTSIASIRSSVRRIHRKQPVGLIVIDYLQLISVINMRGASTNDKVSSISRAIKLMAYEFNCPVLVLSQLSREVERRSDKRPILSDLRDSGAIEQDADAVLFLYADCYNQRKLDEDSTANTPINLELILAKYRHGTVGNRTVVFDRNCGRFYSPATKERDTATKVPTTV